MLFVSVSSGNTELGEKKTGKRGYFKKDLEMLLLTFKRLLVSS